MPAIVVCAACQTKLKVPENSTAKALKCPKCKGIVPITPAKVEVKANPGAAPKAEAPPVEPKPAAPPEANRPADKSEEELEVNEAVDEQEEELEVNEAVDEQEEELEVNEAADEEADEEEEDEDDQEDEDDEDSPLVELGFTKGKDPFKVGEIPELARKAIQKAFVKHEKALWAGRPSKEVIESKAWLGFVVGGVCAAVALLVCLITGGIAVFVDMTAVRIAAPLIGGLFALLFGGVGVLAVVFRKNVGGNVAACYVVSNKRAYIFDGHSAVRAFAPVQLTKVHCKPSDKFEDAGDLIFAYDFMGDQGVQVDREQVESMKNTATGTGTSASTPVGFLNIGKVQLVRRVLHEKLIDPALKKAKQKKREKKRKRRRFY